MAAVAREGGSLRGSPRRRGGAAFAGLPGTSTYIDSGSGDGGFLKGSVARLSRPLPGVKELTEGRTDFFAELTNSVGSEIQRLVRYTLMGYTTPLTEEVEMRAQADIDNGLLRIFELLAAYVDDVATASQELWLASDAASPGEHMLSRQLDESVAHAQRLEQELEKREKDLRKASLLTRQMRAFYASDLENQRDRFRTTLFKSLPELTEGALTGIMDHLAHVKMFDPKDFVDVETANLLLEQRATMEADFALEREALSSRIQKETESRDKYERLWQAENAKAKWLRDGVERLKANGTITAEALRAPPVDDVPTPSKPEIETPQVHGALSIDSALSIAKLRDHEGTKRQMMKLEQDIVEMKRRESVIAQAVGNLNDLVNRQFDMAGEYHGSKEHDLIASVLGDFPAKVGEIQMVLAGSPADDAVSASPDASPSSSKEEPNPEAKIAQLQIEAKVLRTEKEVLKLHLKDAREKLASSEHGLKSEDGSSEHRVSWRHGSTVSSEHEAPEMIEVPDVELEVEEGEPSETVSGLPEGPITSKDVLEDIVRSSSQGSVLKDDADACSRRSTSRSRKSFGGFVEVEGEVGLQTFESAPEPQHTRKRSSIKAKLFLLADVGSQTEEEPTTEYPLVSGESSPPRVPEDEPSDHGVVPEAADAAGAGDEAAAPRLATQGSQTGEENARDPSGPHNTQLEFQIVEPQHRSGRSLTKRVAIGDEDGMEVIERTASQSSPVRRRTASHSPRSARNSPNATPTARLAEALALTPEVVSRATSPIVLTRSSSRGSSGGGELSGEEEQQEEPAAQEPAVLAVDPQPAGSTAPSLQTPRQSLRVSTGSTRTPRGSQASRTLRGSRHLPPVELEEDGSMALQDFVVPRPPEARRPPRMTRQNGDFPRGPPQDDEPPTPGNEVSVQIGLPPPDPAPLQTVPDPQQAELADLGAPEPPASPPPPGGSDEARPEPHLGEAATSPAPRSPSPQPGPPEEEREAEEEEEKEEEKEQQEASEQGMKGSGAAEEEEEEEAEEEEEGGEEENGEEDGEEARAEVDAEAEDPGPKPVEGHEPTREELEPAWDAPEPTREELEEELADVRDNLKVALFERDYMQAQLGLARESAVQAKSEHSQLWRRQTAWLGKCNQILEDGGMCLPIPAALLEPQYRQDALEEVLRAELAGDDQQADEEELQRRLKKRREKALAAAYVEATTVAEGQRRQASAMAESLVPFRELTMTSKLTSLRPESLQQSIAATPRSQASPRSQEGHGSMSRASSAMGASVPQIFRRGTFPNPVFVGDADALDSSPRRGTASAVLTRVGKRKTARFVEATDTDFVSAMASLAEHTAAHQAAQRFVGRASQESTFTRTATTRNTQMSISLDGIDEQLVQDAVAACDYLDYIERRWSGQARELDAQDAEHSDASSVTGSPANSPTGTARAGVPRRTLSGWARQLDHLEAMPSRLGSSSDASGRRSSDIPSRLGDNSDARGQRISDDPSDARHFVEASRELGRSASEPVGAAEDVNLCHVCVRRMRRLAPAGSELRAASPPARNPLSAASPEVDAAPQLARPGAEDPPQAPGAIWAPSLQEASLRAARWQMADGTPKALEDAASTIGGLSAITTAFTERPVTAATGERVATAETSRAVSRRSVDLGASLGTGFALGDPGNGKEGALDLQLAPLQRDTPPSTPPQVEAAESAAAPPPQSLALRGSSPPLAPLHRAPLLELEPEAEDPEPEARSAASSLASGGRPEPMPAGMLAPDEARCAHCGRCGASLFVPAEADLAVAPAAATCSPPRTPEDIRAGAPSVTSSAPAHAGSHRSSALPTQEAAPSAAYPWHTATVDAAQHTRRPPRLLGAVTQTEPEAREEPPALAEAGVQTMLRQLVEQGAQTWISRIADLSKEGAAAIEVVGTQTDGPEVIHDEVSRRLKWARATRQETLHQILGTVGASDGHIEYPTESHEADQLVVELAKLGMDRRALKSLVEPIEVVDVAVQSGVEVGSIDSVLKWMKLNLLQRQNAWLYCLPSEVSPLEDFHNIPGARLEKLVVDFERFLDEILSRPHPAKSAARSALRAKYRARSDSPCSRRARSRSPSPSTWLVHGGKEDLRRNNMVGPYEYPVRFMSSGFDGEQEVTKMVLVPDTTISPTVGKGLCRGRAGNAPIQCPWTWEGSGDTVKSWELPMLASPEAHGQPPKKGGVPRTVEEVLGMPLPPSAFTTQLGAAGLDSDPLCLAWAAENRLILPAGAQHLFPPNVQYPTRAAKALAAVPGSYRPTVRPPQAKAELQFVQFDGVASKLQTHEFVGRKVGDMANSNSNSNSVGKLQTHESVGRRVGDLSISNSGPKVGDMSDAGRTTAPAQTLRSPAPGPLSPPPDAAGRGPEELLPGGDGRTHHLRELLDVLRRAGARSLREGLRCLRAPAVQLQAPVAPPSRAGPTGARPIRSIGPTRPAPSAAPAAQPGPARRPAQQAAAPSPWPRQQPAGGQVAASEQPGAPETPASARAAPRREEAPASSRVAPPSSRMASHEEVAATVASAPVGSVRRLVPADSGSAAYVGCVAWSYGAGTAGADSNAQPADVPAAEASEQDQALATESMDSLAPGSTGAAADGHRPEPASLPSLSAWRKLDAPLQAPPADSAAVGWLPQLRPDGQGADVSLPQPTSPRPGSRSSGGRPGSRSTRRAMTPKEEWQRWSGGRAHA